MCRYISACCVSGSYLFFKHCFLVVLALSFAFQFPEDFDTILESTEEVVLLFMCMGLLDKQLCHPVSQVATIGIAYLETGCFFETQSTFLVESIMWCCAPLLSAASVFVAFLTCGRTKSNESDEQQNSQQYIPTTEDFTVVKHITSML